MKGLKDMWTAPSTAGGLLGTSRGPGGSCPSSCRGSCSNICLRTWATVSEGTGDPGWELWAELLETEPPLPLRSVYVFACRNALDALVARWGGGCPGLNHAAHLPRGGAAITQPVCSQTLHGGAFLGPSLT